MDTCFNGYNTTCFNGYIGKEFYGLKIKLKKKYCNLNLKCAKLLISTVE